MPLRNNFESIAYQYYPKGVDAMLNKMIYEKSKEFRLLVQKIDNGSKKINIKAFKLSLGDFLNKKVYDFSLLSWHDRAYNLQIEIYHEGNKKFVLCINFSVLISYYICYVLVIEKQQNSGMLKYKPTRNFEIEVSLFNDNLTDIKNFIEQQTKFKEFPSDILYKKIPDINFQDIEMNKFTFFNAFFLNDYHTRIY